MLDDINVVFEQVFTDNMYALTKQKSLTLNSPLQDSSFFPVSLKEKLIVLIIWNNMDYFDSDIRGNTQWDIL